MYIYAYFCCVATLKCDVNKSFPYAGWVWELNVTTNMMLEIVYLIVNGVHSSVATPPTYNQESYGALSHCLFQKLRI